jgi:nitrogen-specific signal transduction histidine kinase
MRDVNPLDLLETIRESVLVLEPDLTVRLANRSFCHMFAVAPEHTVGRKLYEIGTDSGTFPSSAPRSRLSFLAEQPSRPSKSTSASRQSAGA